MVKQSPKILTSEEKPPGKATGNFVGLICLLSVCSGFRKRSIGRAWPAPAPQPPCRRKGVAVALVDLQSREV